MAEFPCHNGYRIRYIIQPTLRNQTIVPVLTVLREECPVDQGPRWAMAFLAIFLIVAFVLCSLIVVSISGSFTLKKQMVYHLFINLCIIVMVDCLVNITLSISYIGVSPWTFGVYACHFNSFAMTFIALQMMFGVLLLINDRLLVAKKIGSYMSLSRTKLRVLIIFSWVLSFLIASPLVCGFISSIPYRKRYSCSVSDPYDIYYVIPQLGLLFISFIVILSSTVIVGIIFYKEQKKHKRLRGNQTFSFFDQVLMTPYYKNEAHTSLCVVVLCISFVLLWLPFHGVVIVTPFFTDNWNNETTPVAVVDSVHNYDLESFNAASTGTNTALSDMETNSTEDMSNHVPEMTITPVYETVFIWFRYFFDVLVPILILTLIRDIRQKCQALFLFCRPNTVDSSSPKMISPPYLNASLRGQTPKDKKHKNENMVSFKTPVLFATSEGLHIRTIDDTLTALNDSRSFFKQASSVEPQFTYDLCDVSLAAIPSNEFDNDDNANDNDPLQIENTFNNPVVERAHRNAIGQQNIDAAMNRNFSAASMIKRPPTPPKRRGSSSSTSDNSSKDMEEIDLEPRTRKSSKVVRFDTQLNKEIIRPKSTGSDSALDSSISSGLSNDSGNLADIEEVGSQPKKRSQGSKLKRRPTYPTNRTNIKKKSNSLLHKSEPKRKRSNSKSSVVGGKIKSNHNGPLRNIKSRHMYDNKIDSPSYEKNKC